MGNRAPDLEVHINGEEVFAVHKVLSDAGLSVIASYSGKISRLLGEDNSCLHLVFNGFPGGSETFEKILRFCYNGGKVSTDMNHSNIAAVSNGACFLEIESNVFETEKLLDEIQYWKWDEILGALDQCQSFLELAVSSGVIDKLLDAVVGRVASSCETSPCSSASSSSYGTPGTESLKFASFRASFHDLATLDTDLIRMLVKLMVSRNMDNIILGRFLFFYQKSRCSSTSPEERIRIIETVVELLGFLDVRSLSYKSLFRILRAGSSIKISKSSRSKLEEMIASQLDHATLDSLLVPAPPEADYLYDVRLVLRLLKSFLSRGASGLQSNRMKKVAALIDMYLVEVAPDPLLKPSKFMAILRAVPDSARESLDRVNDAVNLYLQVHSGLSEEQKNEVRSAMNCNNQQKEIIQQQKLKGLLTSVDSPIYLFGTAEKPSADLGSKRSAGKVDLFDDREEMRAQLQGMQWRALKLEKVCHELGTQMASVMKSKSWNQNSAKSVPYLCS